MGSNEYLTATEWYEFLINEVKLPSQAKNEIEKLAHALEFHYIFKDDFINLSEDDLKTTFNFHRQDLLNQIKKWKNSSPNATSQQTNPLMILVDIFKRPINQNQIGEAKSILEADISNVREIVPNCLSAIDTLKAFGDSMVPEEDRVYYRCKACNQNVWVAKGMSAFTEFPGCFICQENWLEGVGGWFRRN